MFTFRNPTWREPEASRDLPEPGEPPMQLILSQDETTILRDLLADYLPALRREVARTEKHDLRHLMVQRQDLVERLLDQLSEQMA
jgi:hypothetical protein